MSDKWKVEGGTPTNGELVLFALTGGFSSLSATEKTYVARNVAHPVTATSRSEVGDRIAAGDFDD